MAIAVVTLGLPGQGRNLELGQAARRASGAGRDRRSPKQRSRYGEARVSGGGEQQSRACRRRRGVRERCSGADRHRLARSAWSGGRRPTRAGDAGRPASRGRACRRAMMRARNQGAEHVSRRRGACGAARPEARPGSGPQRGRGARRRRVAREGRDRRGGGAARCTARRPRRAEVGQAAGGAVAR